MADASAALEMELGRAWELTQHLHHREALAAIATLAGRLPRSRDLLYLRALNLRLTGQIPDALAALEGLEQLQPRCSRIYVERGHCYAALQNLPGAIDAFVRSVRINPTQSAAWSMLQRLCRMTCDDAGAEAAARQLATLSQLPPEVVEANSLFADGYLLPAEKIIRNYLRRDPQNVGAMRLLARIGMDRNALEDAESLLHAILCLAPDFHAARLDYAMALLRRQKYPQALQESNRLLKHNPEDREYLKLYAAACIGLGDHEPVIALYERLLEGIPPSAAEASDLRLWRGNALKSTGRSQEAIADYQTALAARPDFAVAWFSLANLKTYRFAAADVTRMRNLELQPATSSLDRWYLCFSLGKALEDCGDYPSSWQYYARGNALVRAESNYKPEIAETNARLLREVCTAGFFSARAGWGNSDLAPIFVLGLPRSGSTLIEQILASHSLVEGTEELPHIERYVNELCGGSLTPRALRGLTAGTVRRLGERYIAETGIYRHTNRPFFIDKMPNNFWHVGLIRLMLPNAKIIDARREPMACCFGNLKQLFGAGLQPFSYGIDDMARYYRVYLAVMRHWHAVLPGHVLTVQHEAVVEDLEASVRGILAHCGLDFEPACLQFHQTRRSVRSASSEQVRAPISAAGVHQWRNYAPWLAPLQEALGDTLVDYKD